MHFSSWIAAIAALYLTFVHATSLSLRFQPSNLIPNPSTLPSSTHAVLTSSNETLKALITKANVIRFSHIPPGSYLCDVYTQDYNIAPMRVDVKLSPTEAEKDDIRYGWENGDIEIWQTFRGNEWDNKGERLGGGKGSCEVNVMVMGQKQFYQERSTFSPLALLSNPMILIGVAGLLIMVAMPKLLENMDPEMREEFEKQQKSNVLAQGLTGGSPMGGFDMASWMAGSAGTGKNGGKESAGSGKVKKRT